MYMEVSFLPTLSCTSMNFATQRSRQMASPLVSSPSLYLGGIHFLWHDLDNLLRERERYYSITVASKLGFLIWILFHSFGESSETKSMLSLSYSSLHSGFCLTVFSNAVTNLEWKAWIWD